MKHFKYILFTMAFLVSTYYSKAQWPPTDPAYTITFGDEFNDTTGYFGNKIDTSKWVTNPPWNNGSTYRVFKWRDTVNQSWKFDTLHLAGYNLYDFKDTSNVHVIPGSPGICRLIARKGSFNSYIWDFSQNPWQIPKTFKYSNGALTSKRLLRYGYYEIKFRLPSLASPDTAHNYKPTCWLYNDNYPRIPDSAGHNEIDIFEIDMSEPNRYAYTHSLYYAYKHKLNDTLDVAEHRHHIANITNVTGNTWHTGSIFWDKDSVTFYYDGVRSALGTFTTFPSTHQTYQWHADSLWPMRTFIEAYIPNDFTYYGAHQPHPQRADTAQMPFPFVYEIDYYKVWQLKTACDTNKTYLTATLTSFNSKLYQSLILGGSGGNVNFTGTGKASALGVNYVLIDEGTEIGNNVEFYVQTLKCPGNVSEYHNKLSLPPENSPARRKQ
jgi:hypothetical protein